MTAYTRQLVHTCDIEAPTNTQNSVGEPIPTWAVVNSGVACRLVVKEEKIASPGIGLMTKTIYKLLLASDITPAPVTGYRVSNINIENDAEKEGPFRVEETLPRRGPRGKNHITLKLKRVI